MADTNNKKRPHKKPLTINPSSANSILDMLKPIADIGSAAFVVKAIKEHTRAMVAREFFKSKSLPAAIDKLPFDDQAAQAFRLADTFLAAGKKPDSTTENDQAA